MIIPYRNTSTDSSELNSIAKQLEDLETRANVTTEEVKKTLDELNFLLKNKITKINDSGSFNNFNEKIVTIAAEVLTKYWSSTQEPLQNILNDCSNNFTLLKTIFQKLPATQGIFKNTVQGHLLVDDSVIDEQSFETVKKYDKQDLKTIRFRNQIINSKYFYLLDRCKSKNGVFKINAKKIYWDTFQKSLEEVVLKPFEKKYDDGIFIDNGVIFVDQHRVDFNLLKEILESHSSQKITHVRIQGFPKIAIEIVLHSNFQREFRRNRENLIKIMDSVLESDISYKGGVKSVKLSPKIIIENKNLIQNVLDDQKIEIDFSDCSFEEMEFALEVLQDPFSLKKSFGPKLFTNLGFLKVINGFWSGVLPNDLAIWLKNKVDSGLAKIKEFENTKTIKDEDVDFFVSFFKIMHFCELLQDKSSDRIFIHPETVADCEWIIMKSLCNDVNLFLKFTEEIARSEIYLTPLFIPSTIEDEKCAEILKNQPYLTKLSLKRKNLTPEIIRNMSILKLQALELKDFDNQMLKSLISKINIDHLTVFALSNCTAEESTCRAFIQNLTELQHLELKNCFKLSNQIVGCISNLKNLNELLLRDLHGIDNNFKIDKLKNIKKLKIVNCNFSGEIGNVDKQLIKSASNLPKLDFFELDYWEKKCQIGPASMKRHNLKLNRHEIAHISKYELLIDKGILYIDQDHFGHLSYLRQRSIKQPISKKEITHVKIQRCPKTEIEIALLPNFEKLFKENRKKFIELLNGELEYEISYKDGVKKSVKLSPKIIFESGTITEMLIREMSDNKKIKIDLRNFDSIDVEKIFDIIEDSSSPEIAKQVKKQFNNPDFFRVINRLKFGFIPLSPELIDLLKRRVEKNFAKIQELEKDDNTKYHEYFDFFVYSLSIMQFCEHLQNKNPGIVLISPDSREDYETYLVKMLCKSLDPDLYLKVMDEIVSQEIYLNSLMIPSFIDNEKCAEILKNQPDIQSLWLETKNLTPQIISNISNLKLQSLHLVDFNDLMIRSLVEKIKTDDLFHLNLRTCSIEDDTCKMFIQKMSNLNSLSLNKCNKLSNRIVDFISDRKNIKTLVLNNLYGLDDDCKIENLKYLENLKIVNSKSGLGNKKKIDKVFSKLSNLKSFEFGINNQIKLKMDENALNEARQNILSSF